MVVGSAVKRMLETELKVDWNGKQASLWKWTEDGDGSTSVLVLLLREKM